MTIGKECLKAFLREIIKMGDNFREQMGQDDRFEILTLKNKITIVLFKIRNNTNEET